MSSAPSLLIASPQMNDPIFGGAVVLLFSYDEDGAQGVIINKPLDRQVSEVLRTDLPITTSNNAQVMMGGPVEQDIGTIITRFEINPAEGWTLKGNINVSRSFEVLERLLSDGVDLILGLGYAGWGPGQLDQEILSGGWLVTDADPFLVFDAPPESRYSLALASLGLTKHTIWMQPIDE